MHSHAKHIYEEALTLSALEKVELIEHLYFSLDSKESRKKIDELWSEEAEQRVAAYENGEIDVTPALEVFDKIEKMKKDNEY